MPKKIKVKNGFTIIEVVLVLAIAGLIFLMVFVAFPALQRSQNDTQRQQDIARLSTQITNFKTNNNAKIPGSTSINNGKATTVTGSLTGVKVSGADPKIGTWAYFYNNYLLAGGDTFKDPDGSPYSLQVVLCNPKEDGYCTTQRTSTSFADQDHKILVTLKARCEGENVVPGTGDNNIALAYKREGGGVICIAN